MSVVPSERIQRQIDRLLDEAEQALAAHDWPLVQTLAREVLSLDPGNEDGEAFARSAERMLGEAVSHQPSAISSPAVAAIGSRQSAVVSTTGPTAFVSGRYTVKRFLGEGGKKQVYLAHDELLDRDVAFALIKTEGLDETGRARIKREAQAMGRLGSHPHIVSVYDMGEEVTGDREQGTGNPEVGARLIAPAPEPGTGSQYAARPTTGPPAHPEPVEGRPPAATRPYIVTELMAGGDVEGLIEKVPEYRPALKRTLEIGTAVCKGLEFAHSHGIVHRDLKPGNVWLTEDGTAKLGDFGLAVALDRSRLTQAGMMVGTVSYMPPEQAMGGEVTPRSDLYSLGAMLYEMVTGRPPFVGDESVAIITQHLNVAPVAPSWHNPAVPPGLEALILRLLEKDPAKRPASAGEVEAMLAAVAAQAVGSRQSAVADGAGTTAHSLLPIASENPLYRRAFVGREPELRQLQAAYDAATSGQGALAMVVGEPGIGKTSLCEQLATYAIVRGGKVLIGHCYEEGSLSLPYLPFVEAIRSYVLAREPEGLRQDLGTGAGEVARIVSEVRDRLQVELPPAGAPEDDRWRLLQAVTAFLRNAATVQPLVIVLEDLHDADRGTLDLLLHLSRNLGGARLVVVGTYRDVEVDRAHPLSATLAELRRGQNFLRVPLRGLTAGEVQRMLASVSQQEIPWPLAELVHRQTEGNPLFVQEMLRYLVEEGLVERRQGALRRVGEESLAGRIPEGLRDVIGKRLSRLSETTNQVLSVASVVGREFRLDVLQQVVGIPEEELYSALEEANALAVVEQRQSVGTVSFRFTHAFFRQTLYEEIFVPRRIRLHQQVARALEAVYGRRTDEHAAELAEHFAQTTDAEDLERALRYSQVAAERALRVYAYGEAVRHLEQALKVQDVLDPDDVAQRCDLLLSLGEAMLPAGDLPRAVAYVAPEALALAESIEDSRRATRASLLALQGLGGGPAAGTPEFGRWLERADRHATPGSLDRVRTDLYRANRESMAGRQRAGFEMAQRALGLARELNEDEALYSAAGSILNSRIPEFQEQRLRLAQELAERRPNGVSARALGWVLECIGFAFLTWGDRARAEEMWRRLSELAERTKDGQLLIGAKSGPLRLSAIDGRLEETVVAAEQLRQWAEELGVPALGRLLAFMAILRPLCYLGRVGEALAAQPEDALLAAAEGRSLVFAADIALCMAHLGRWGEVQRLLADLHERRDGTGGVASLGYTGLAKYLEVAVLAQDRQTAALLHPYLAPAAELISDRYPTVIARHLGAASALLGDREAARRYYEQALEVAGKVRFRPEIALTHLGIAELLLGEGVLRQAQDERAGRMSAVGPDGGSVGARFIAPVPSVSQRTEALQHLDFAIAELRDMKMQPALERALRHKEVLKA